MAILVRGGQVLRGERPALERADVLVDGDRIVSVGPSVAAPAGAEAIEATGFLVIPGLVNAHTHAHNNLLRGLAPRWSLEDLLNHAPALNGNRTLEDQYLSAALGAIEMVKTGCTAAYDLVLAAPAPTLDDMETVARAYADVGLRATLAPAVADTVFYRSVPGLMQTLPAEMRRRIEAMRAAPTTELLALAEQTIRRLHGTAGGRIRVAVAPTIPTLSTDALLDGMARLAREHGVGLHTHLSESKMQVIEAQRRWGETAVAHLEKIGALGPGFVGAHGVWLTDDDMRRIAAAGGAVAHNPASNLRLGSGIAAVREMLDHGVTVGLGCDGSMCSDNQNLFEAMRIAALVGNVRFPHHTERWLSAADIVRMATVGSARLLGLADEIGAIDPGRQADLVLLRADSTFLRPMSDVLGSLVYAETGTAVDTVLVAGRVVLQGGRVLGVDEDRLRARAQEAADRLRARNVDAFALAAEIAPYLSAACRAAAAAPCAVNRYAVPVD
jgi:guanine deaminase